MKNLILTVCVIVVAIPLLLILPLIAGTGISRAIFEYELKDMPNETDKIPAYVDYGTLYTENGKVGISGVCRKQYKDASLMEIFCIADGKAIFVYTQQTAFTWILASADLETKEYQELSRFENTATYYRRNLYGAYGEKNGYFHNGKVVLNDGETVLTYDVATGETITCSYSDYPFPQRTIYGECTEDKTLNLHIDDDIYTFTLDDMAAGSDGIARIVALRDKKNWDKKSYLIGFLNNDSIHSVGERIYCVDSIVDYVGSPYVVILEYDREQGVWQYVTRKFCGADTYGNCYVIPTM